MFSKTDSLEESATCRGLSYWSVKSTAPGEPPNLTVTDSIVLNLVHVKSLRGNNCSVPSIVVKSGCYGEVPIHVHVRVKWNNPHKVRTKENLTIV